MRITHRLLFQIDKLKNISPRNKYDSGYSHEINKIISDTFNNKMKIPTIIGGVEYYDNISKKQISPINNTDYICEYNDTNYKLLAKYLNDFNKYKQSLESFSVKDRKETFRKARFLLSTKYKEQMLAYTIIGQGKSMYEAEIDAICELGDFLNFNSSFYDTIISRQPISFDKIKNESHYNPLNGFVAAITPFNFTAIGGNLASAPTLFGNSVIWKPSDSAILSNYLFYEILIEAGLPSEAVSFTPSCPKLFSNTILQNENLGGLLFTGSSDVFSDIYKNIGVNIDRYKNYPRLIGETGGKNFHFIHTELDNNDIKRAAKKTIESAYGYAGQKCSACSIVYVPKVHYNKFIKEFLKERDIFMNYDAFKNYGVINSQSYHRTKYLLKDIEKESYYDIICGGNCYDNNGSYYIEPTLIKCQIPNDIIFSKEYFAPILALYCYDDTKIEEAMNICKMSSKYGLTGSVFSNDEVFIEHSKQFFKEKCGNFYINDKSTGSVVGQQPFGGSCKSGTNDKAGDINLLYRLFNQQNIKRNYTN